MNYKKSFLTMAMATAAVLGVISTTSMQAVQPAYNVELVLKSLEWENIDESFKYRVKHVLETLQQNPESFSAFQLSDPKVIEFISNKAFRDALIEKANGPIEQEITEIQPRAMTAAEKAAAVKRGIAFELAKIVAVISAATLGYIYRNEIDAVLVEYLPSTVTRVLRFVNNSIVSLPETLKNSRFVERLKGLFGFSYPYISLEQQRSNEELMTIVNLNGDATGE